LLSVCLLPESCFNEVISFCVRWWQMKLSKDFHFFKD
jgi:hypothetical protein